MTVQSSHAMLLRDDSNESSAMNPGIQKQFDRGDVLQKALELFWAQGYEATGMAQLVQHVGIGRQSLYNEFGDKRGLFLASLEAYADAMYAEKAAILERPGSPLGNVRAMCHHWLAMVEQQECMGCMLANTAAEFGASDPDVQQIVTASLRRSEDAFCGVFQRAQDAGELDDSVNPRDLARLFMSAGQGVSVLSRLSGSNAVISSTCRALLQLLPANG